MRRDATAHKASLIAVGLLLTSLLTVQGCSDDTPDPRQIFGLDDAANSDLLPEVEEAIEVANTALAVEGRFVLQPTWKPKRKQRDRQSRCVRQNFQRRGYRGHSGGADAPGA